MRWLRWLASGVSRRRDRYVFGDIGQRMTSVGPHLPEERWVIIGLSMDFNRDGERQLRVDLVSESTHKSQRQQVYFP